MKVTIYLFCDHLQVSIKEITALLRQEKYNDIMLEIPLKLNFLSRLASSARRCTSATANTTRPPSTRSRPRARSASHSGTTEARGSRRWGCSRSRKWDTQVRESFCKASLYKTEPFHLIWCYKGKDFSKKFTVS